MLVSINKDTYAPNGAFLQKGRGPNEVMDYVLLYGNAIRSVNGQAVLGYLDARKDWQEVDLLGSLANGRSVHVNTVEVPQDFKTPGPLACLGDGRFLGLTLVDNMSRYERSVQGGGQDKLITAAMAQLNNAHVNSEQSPFAYYLVGTIPGYNPEKRRVVEASGMLNTIHIYDLEGGFARTLYVGDHPEDLTEKEREMLTDYSLDMMRATCLQVYREFFSVLWYGGQLFMFDWEGKLLQAIRLEGIPAFEFDFDFEGGRLFTLDNETGALWCFDLSSYGPLFTSGHRF